VPDTVVDFAVHGGDIYLATSREASRYRIVRTSLSAPDIATATVVVPQSEFVVDQLHPAKTPCMCSSTAAARPNRSIELRGRRQARDASAPEGFPLPG